MVNSYIMKKIKIILYAFLSFVLITGCDNGFGELNTDPNNSTALPAHLLLGYTQRQFMNTHYGMQRGGDMGSCWAQHMSKVQYNDEARYVPRRGVIDAIWDSFYFNVISEASAMYDLAGDEGNTNLQGVALVMQATTYQMLTELYGPIPFTEAIDPAIVQPAYDSEAVVWTGIIEMYTNAAAILASGTGSVTASSDLFYGGDTSQWLKLANTLKFRALMRASSVLSVGADLQALVDGGNMFSSNSDDAHVSYLSAVPDANPIFETIVDGSRLEYKINSVLVEMLEGLNDPRLAVYAAENASGDILGKPAGYGNTTTLPNEDLGYTYANISGLGDFYLDPELPGILMSYSELKFLMAEAANEGLISGGTAGALGHYNDGIAANFAFNGLDATTYLEQLSIPFTTQNDGRNKIGNQKWIALYSQGFESWTEWRRTGLPLLSPAVEGDISSIPTRFYYPTAEPSLNQDNYNSAVQSIGGDELTSPLIWQ